MAKLKPKSPDSKPKIASNITDIAHPDSIASSPNSKSVIITSRPLMRDPMMAMPKALPDATDTADTTEVAAPKPAVVHREKVILPQSQQPATPEASNESSPAAKPESVSDTPDAAFTVSESFPAGATEVAPNAEMPSGAEATELTELERQKELDGLIISEKYFLPINSSGQKKARKFIALGALLILVLGAAWVDIALDANLIDIAGVEAPTNFFEN